VIQLTRLDGDVLLVNPHSIRTVARLGPNSSLRFGDGRSMVVVEPPEAVAQRVAEWEAEVARVARPMLPPAGSSATTSDDTRMTGPAADTGPRHLRLVR
jgi:uncharacterized protein YlzI (FlbEa/FlbD family)